MLRNPAPLSADWIDRHFHEHADYLYRGVFMGLAILYASFQFNFISRGACHFRVGEFVFITMCMHFLGSSDRIYGRVDHFQMPLLK